MAPTRSYEEIVDIIFLGIGFVLYLPTVIYFAYPLWHTWHAKKLHMFRKRHTDLTLYSIYALLCNIIMTSVMSLMISPSVFGKSISNAQIILFIFIAILSQFAVQFFYSSLFIRLWLTYYDIKYNMLIGSNQWKSVINADYNASKSWFVRFRNSVGNKKALIRALWIFNILFVVIDVILVALDIFFAGHTHSNYSETFSRVYLLCVTIGCWLFATIVHCLLRKVEYFDDLHILREFVLFYKVMMAAICVAIVYCLIFGLVLFPTLGAEYGDLLWIISLHFLMQTWLLCNICLIYVMSRWVFKQLQNDTALQAQYGELLHKLSNIRSEIELAQTRAIDQDDSKEITLQHILRRTEYLCSFMQHLSREFSAECLLSVIEFIAFREHVKGKGDIINNTTTSTKRLNLELSQIILPADIPRSSIVFDSQYDNKSKAQQLFDKYIKIGSDYEINISAKKRNALSQLFGNTQIENDAAFDDPCIFDICIEDMLTLLGYSFSRFQNKPEFRKLEYFAL